MRLAGQAGRLQDAIDALNQSGPDPTVLGVLPALGSQLAEFAGRNASINNWAGQVGKAFMAADGGEGEPWIETIWLALQEHMKVVAGHSHASRTGAPDRSSHSSAFATGVVSPAAMQSRTDERSVAGRDGSASIISGSGTRLAAAISRRYDDGLRPGRGIFKRG